MSNNNISGSTPIISCSNLCKTYRPGWFGAKEVKHVLTGINLEIREGESVALVGESGSGKSTLGRQLLGFETPSAGEVRFMGNPLGQLDANGIKEFRRNVQVVFQDSIGAVDPRFRIGRVIDEPLRHLTDLPENVRRDRIADLLQMVSLHPHDAGKLPVQMSGGQLQRVCIARALASNPKLIVLDEAVSNLDLTLQIQVLDLLTDLRKRVGVAYLFITHDLRLVQRFCDRLAVLEGGKLVEEARVEHGQIHLQHPMSRNLQEAILPARPTPRHKSASAPA